MLDNPAIDVVIGLIFIYVLYSLLVTTVTELISTIFKLRANTLKRGIKRMLDDDGGIAVFSETFLERPEIKYLGRAKFPGRRKQAGKYRFPSYIKPSTFSKAVVNTLKTKDRIELSNTRLRLKESSVQENQSQTEGFLYDLLREADNDSNRFRTLLEDWYNETMDRVSGWYKRRIQLITFIVGLLIAFLFNVDTIGIANKLSKEGKARTELVKAASAYAEAVKTDTAGTDTLALKKVSKLIANIEETESVISVNRVDYCEADPKDIWMNIFGCILTAIALSLGSPFWFDLLNKLIKLRASGTQEKTTDKSTKNQPVG